ncbi:hypothetical protein AVEN_264859-1 [Araneus ventricosus]|uniref:Integrase catalytic domain-containing protein n=1 Tax=Araneus ventricosus TaxID=182803 RepID=A0A4Y2L1P7_ARAVE|nr:hypothetical protein AVEN_264859-1 [Araneus ventricosus]
MGAMIGARILRYLKLNLNFPISRMYLWSDSLIALHWIKGAASKWKPFVSNRVIEIQSNADPANWHHCSGKDNPADYISRGASAEKLMNSSIWIHGPQWLCQKEENWPKGSNCVQVTAPLPAARVEQLPPFSIVGIDFGGPLYTKNSDNINYIVLFTCGVTRVVHLEMVHNLTTETFHLALRRFIARRGLCSEIWSDNARTFKKAELELKHLWTIINHPVVKDFYASHKIQWRLLLRKL